MYRNTALTGWAIKQRHPISHSILQANRQPQHFTCAPSQPATMHINMLNSLRVKSVRTWCSVVRQKLLQRRRQYDGLQMCPRRNELIRSCKSFFAWQVRNNPIELLQQPTVYLKLPQLLQGSLQIVRDGSHLQPPIYQGCTAEHHL